MWINTIEFSPVATGKEICNAHPYSLEMKEWVSVQLDRFKNGYTIGGQHITGIHYFFLNFYKLKDKQTKKLIYPRFLDFQSDFFKAIEVCKEQKKGICAVKRRQVGFSEMVASIILFELWFYEKPQILIATEEETQLKPLKDYTSNGINELNKTIFAKNLEKDTPNHKRLGYKRKGSDIWEGQRGEMLFTSFGMGRDMKAVGLTPSILVVDEAGKASGNSLIDFYEFVKPALIDDFTGQMQSLPIIFGATGKEGKSDGLETMFYEPDTYNLLSFKYEGEDRPVGFFCEGWRLKVLDKDGNSDEQKGTDILIKERNELSKSKNTTALRMNITQFPLNPKEAFLRIDEGFFNLHLLEIQREKLLTQNEPMEIGDIEIIEGEAKFIPNANGKVVIYKKPELDDNGKVKRGMYISGCDTFHTDTDEEKKDRTVDKQKRSFGAMVIFKRLDERSSDLCHLPVAYYLDRPKTVSEFLNYTIKINMYYDCMMMAEATNTLIKDTYMNKNKLHYLAFKPRVFDNVIKDSNNRSRYGCPMNEKFKWEYCVPKTKEYIEEYCDRIPFLALIDEMIKFDRINNFDLISAFFMVLVYDADLFDFKLRKVNKKQKWGDWQMIDGKLRFSNQEPKKELTIKYNL